MLPERAVHDLLTDPLPDSFVLFGREYPIRTDLRHWILVTELFEEDVPPYTKVRLAAELLLIGGAEVFRRLCEEEGEAAYNELLRAVHRFSSCGRTSSEGVRDERRGEAVFDFTFDAERIYAAFWQAYGIDLCDCADELHFWRFMALLRNLPRETEFMQAVGLRMTDTSRIEDDALRRRIRRARAAVRIRHDEGKEKKDG